jgi:Na+-driven multidrug efflux pump
MNQRRNQYLINKALKNFLFASVLTMIINQLSSTINGIIASHLVSPDALSATTLYLPVNMVVSALATFVGIGGTILATKAMGRRDKQAVSDILSTALLSVLLGGVLLAVAGFVFGGEITKLLTTDEHIYPLMKPYLTIMLGCGVLPMVNMFFNQCVDIDGFPRRVTKTVLLIGVCDTCLSLLFVGAFDMGIQGAALATTAAYLAGCLYSGMHLFSTHSGIRFRLSMPAFERNIGPNLAQGAPLLISNIVLVVMFYLMNNIVQDRLGHEGMFALSLCVNIFMLGTMVSNGFGNTILSLGGFLYGQRDFSGARLLVKECLLCIVGITLAFTLLVIAYPTLLTRLFGANTPELETIANDSIRIFIGCLPPICLVLTLANLYQMLGRLMMPPVLVVSLPVVLLSSMKIFAGSANDELLWYAFPLTGIIVFVIALLFSEIVRQKNRSHGRLTFLTLLPLNNDDLLYETSLKNEAADFHHTIHELPHIIEQFHLEPSVEKHVQNCTEEVLLNTLSHSGIEGNGHYTDLRMVQNKDKFTVSLKYEGRPFNPLTLLEEKQQLGLKIVFGLSESVDYKYMYGQNMLYLTWTIKVKSEE